MGRGEHVLKRGARSVLQRLLAPVCAALVALLLIGTANFDPADARGEERALKLLNVHTNERAEIVFKRNGRYDQAGLRQINHILRDWRRNEPTKMDPQLLDLLWTAYQESGSTDYIHVICGYRAPATNGMLRSRSSGVAKNSLHIQGKAIDFFIPGVQLAKLRAIGLRMQAGGVGFYPSSGSPFVHMDTGSVRHWPRMNRQQLVAVFPDGGTIHVPSDGKPLPGYQQALADYKSRKASGEFAVAANFRPSRGGLASLFAQAAAEEPASAAPIQLAAVSEDEPEDEVAGADEPARRAVVVASYATGPTPMPRLAPRHTIIADPIADTLAAIAALPPLPVARPAPAPVVLAAAEPVAAPATPGFDFGSPEDWTAPAVPVALAEAVASRDQARRGASVPIAPTSVVATIDMGRPFRADAITTAVLRTADEPSLSVPRVMAYAAADEPLPVAPRPQRAIERMTSAGVPMPLFNPRRQAERTGQVATLAEPAFETTGAIARVVAVVTDPAPAPLLTMTALDTVGLRQWIGAASTRQMAYALLTMPDYTQTLDLMQKPAVTYGAGFGAVAYAGLRTDRFSGPSVLQPRMVDLSRQVLASIR